METEILDISAFEMSDRLVRERALFRYRSGHLDITFPQFFTCVRAGVTRDARKRRKNTVRCQMSDLPFAAVKASAGGTPHAVG